ncbi:purine-nucleoside phosphorylase [Neorhodopirellula lusitana]|nr:purine-nucleoside phosphorylase [Neorhodopirellula lusitana]
MLSANDPAAGQANRGGGPFGSFDIAVAKELLGKRAPQWIEACSAQPPVAIVLGSGLGGLADLISSPTSVPYGEIPGLATTTAAGHRGEFLLGWLAGAPVIAMAGRLHAYEGHSIDAVTRPMALMASLEPRAVIVSCAAGGLNPRYEAGDLVLIDEHMSLLHGLLGFGNLTADLPGQSQLSPSEHVQGQPIPADSGAESEEKALSTWPANRYGGPTCDERLAAIAMATSRRDEFRLHSGSYLAVTGPNYETRAECRMMRSWGFDLVGMSTVPELVLASRAGLPTLAIAVVTNMAVPDAPQAASHDDVLAVSSTAGVRLQSVVEAIAVC